MRKARLVVKTNQTKSYRDAGQALIELGYVEQPWYGKNLYRKPNSRITYLIAECDRFNYTYYSIKLVEYQREMEEELKK